MEELRSQHWACWECQATTDEPIAVTVRTPSEGLSRFLLCLKCYYVYFLPLTPDGSRTLVLTRGSNSGQLTGRGRELRRPLLSMEGLPDL